MEKRDFEEIEALFWTVLALPEQERDAFLQGIPDDGLRTTVAAMVREDAQTPDLTGRLGNAFGRVHQSLRPGERLGAWRIVSEIGRGGHGIVYLAERADGQFELQAAIKLISGVPSLAASHQLRHERQLLASLRHPHIARLLDGGETADGHPYLVMEYIRGLPLTVACDERRLAAEARVRMFLPILDAVHFAHQHLVVHRDLKPGNILVREDGKPVLLDFGVAKLLDPTVDTHETQHWLTPAYASPEQLRGDLVSTASDVYSLGVILSELVRGRAPSRGRPEPGVPLTQGGDSLRSLDRELRAVVAKACATDPRDRYASAQLMAEDLARWLDGFPVLAARPRPAYAFAKLVKRRPFESGLIAALLLALGWFGWNLAEERNQAERYAADANAVSQFLLELFQQADPSTGNRQISAEQIVDFGEQRLRARDDMAPYMRARLAGTLGSIASRLGRPERASALLLEAVLASESSPESLPVEQRTAHILQLAAALDHRARYPEAERWYLRALALLPPDAPERARVLARRGLMQARQRQFEAARRTLDSALAATTLFAPEVDVLRAEVQLYRAELEALADRPARGRSLVDDPIALLRRRLSANDPALQEALSIQAMVLREAGESAQAETVLREILTRRRAALAEDSWLIAAVHDALGHVFYERGESKHAHEQFLAALESARHSLAPDDPALASYLNNVAELYEERGRPDLGTPLIREALGIIERTTSGQELQLVRYRQNLGRMLLLAGEASESRHWLEIVVPDVDDPRFRLQAARQRLHLAEWHRRHGEESTARRLLQELHAAPESLGPAPSHRYAFALRIQASLDARDGDSAVARARLVEAIDLAQRSRGRDFVGTGLGWLQLAELEAAEGRPAEARKARARASEVLTPVLLPGAHELERLALLQ